MSAHLACTKHVLSAQANTKHSKHSLRTNKANYTHTMSTFNTKVRTITGVLVANPISLLISLDGSVSTYKQNALPWWLRDT